jgi:hypothetical protein
MGHKLFFFDENQVVHANVVHMENKNQNSCKLIVM